VVVRRQRERPLELGQERLAPAEHRPAHALDQQQRLALAALEVVEAHGGEG
jgi:hypothetical protein